FAYLFFFFQAEDGIRDFHVTGVQTCALPIFRRTIPAQSLLTSVEVATSSKSIVMPASSWPRSDPAAALRTAAEDTAFFPLAGSEIGRASGRERVWSAGVGGAGKKKEMS